MSTAESIYENWTTTGGRPPADCFAPRAPRRRLRPPARPAARRCLAGPAGHRPPHRTVTEFRDATAALLGSLIRLLAQTRADVKSLGDASSADALAYAARDAGAYARLVEAQLASLTTLAAVIESS